ncbi:fasciclin domain-containing protein [Zunongwangia sp. F363]|uniref:Fasciclin domain-containing protein n=1 Tax=Autumnicola tepida TaxID=3075595 RepID=A0ABU3CBU7_9FLAO|nr:fasciclin domain-containing protein [Zunongwangia sp. F363]MDT0643510.1 fasciclin domain-containing protein [Zunongwangia sp. F363]
MKTPYLKSVLVAFLTVVGASIYGCGGASSNSENSNNTYDQSNSAGSTIDGNTMTGNETDQNNMTTSNAELPYPSSDMDYDNMFGGVDTKDYDILDLIGRDKNLSTFAALAKMANTGTKLNYTGPVTVFAPTNEAFEDMPLEKFNMLKDPNNKAQLSRFIQRHILPGKVSAIDFNSSQAIETSSEEEITIDTEMSGNVIYVGGAEVVKSDIDAKNGIIHIVSSVVEPTRDVFTD